MKLGEATARLETRLELILTSQSDSTQATSGLQEATRNLYHFIHTRLKDLLNCQSSSTDLVLRNAHGASQVATKEIRRQNAEQGTQTSSLHKKLDQVDVSIGAMRDADIFGTVVVLYLVAFYQNFIPSLI